ncbi:hypothetical protein SAMN06296241_2741 [Salinimicrobium sediminis]|uniref:LTXXQ motif family protein n=1 Tax=Salinimicrobium sediminis TaxID=1343891 RepID=A0A285X7A4_9FLAO|nr:hypothetical protein [Salinimicrobium sediminis]SOC81168.1 hypothetical protein SAMN06296241_2741 [Salinimicrobium sediminis]
MVTINKTYKLLLLISIAFLTSAITYSQTRTQPEASQELQEAAKEQVEYWENELSLTAKQSLLMEHKIIEFVFKKDNVIQSNLDKKEKSRQLLELKELENRDMRDILTKPQFDRYLMLQEQKIQQQNTDN